MSFVRPLVALVLGGLLLGPAVAMADDVYSYVDDEGVLHFSNAPSDRRYRKVNRGAGGTGRPWPAGR